MLSCIGGGRLQITGSGVAEYNARLGGSIDDFIYAALRALPTEMHKMQAPKLLGRSVPHASQLMRSLQHTCDPLNLRLE